MSTVLNTTRVDEAEAALRAFEGEPLSRESAAVLLSMWAGAKQLTRGERIRVLRRFPLGQQRADAVAQAERKAYAAGYVNALNDLLGGEKA